MSQPFIEPWPSLRSPTVIVREWGRRVDPECDGEGCGKTLHLKLMSDAILTDKQCDEVLDEYLKNLGWDVADDEKIFCPRCVSVGADTVLP